MHSDACVLKAAQIGASILAEKGMTAEEFNRRMTDEVGADYTKRQRDVFKKSFELYMDKRNAAKAAQYARREDAYVDKQAGGSTAQGTLGAGFHSPADVVAFRREFATLDRAKADASTAAAKSRAALAKQYAGLEHTSLTNVIRAQNKLQPLVGLFTPLRNALSNAGNIGAEEALTTPLAAGLDMLVSTGTRVRTVAPGDLRLQVQAGAEGASQGLKDARDILAKGGTPEQFSRLELPPETNTNWKYFDAYQNAMRRFVGAQDAPFRGYVVKRALASRARAQALTEAKQGTITKAQVVKRSRDLYANPPADMELGAITDADFTLFNNDSAAAKGFETFKRSLGDEGAALAELVVRYPKVPSNVLARTVDFLGGGLVRGAYKGRKFLPAAAKSLALAPADLAGSKGAQEARERLGEVMRSAFGPTAADQVNGQRAMVQMFARGMYGPAVFALGWAAAGGGKAVGFYPTQGDTGDRKRDEAAGMAPGSIILGGHSVNVAWLGPLAGAFLMGATMRQAADDRGADSFKDRAKKVADAGVSAVTSMSPFAEDVEQFTRTVTNPDRYGEWLGGQVKTAIPGVGLGGVRELSNALDSKDRSVRPADGDTFGGYLADEGRGFVDAFRRDLPGLRQSLPERTDAFGQPTQHNRFDQLFKSKDVNASPYLSELRRLDLDAPALQPEKGEAPDAFKARANATGARRLEAGDSVVGSDAYKGLTTDEQRRAVLADAASRAKDADLATDTGKGSFAHNTDVEARKVAAVDRLKADPRYAALSEKQQKTATERLGGAFGDAKYTPKEGEKPERATAYLRKAQRDLTALTNDDALSREITKALRTAERAPR